MLLDVAMWCCGGNVEFSGSARSLLCASPLPAVPDKFPIDMRDMWPGRIEERDETAATAAAADAAMESCSEEGAGEWN